MQKITCVAEVRLILYTPDKRTTFLLFSLPVDDVCDLHDQVAK